MNAASERLCVDRSNAVMYRACKRAHIGSQSSHHSLFTLFLFLFLYFYQLTFLRRNLILIIMKFSASETLCLELRMHKEEKIKLLCTEKISIKKCTYIHHKFYPLRTIWVPFIVKVFLKSKVQRKKILVYVCIFFKFQRNA